MQGNKGMFFSLLFLPLKVLIQFQVSRVALFVPGSLLEASCCETNLGAIRVLKGGLLLVPGFASSHPGWQACVGRVLGMGFRL